MLTVGRLGRDRPPYRGNFNAPAPPSLIAPRTDERDGYRDHPISRGDKPSIFVSPSQMINTKPMMTYGNFVKTQRDDASFDVYQKRFEEYQQQYLNDLAEKFFTANVSEEWFRDRYDPHRIMDREHQVCEWASIESELMKKAIIENPSEILEAVSLEPATRKTSNADIIDSEHGKKTKDELHFLCSTFRSVLGVSKCFPGHIGRTIYITGIPDCCTKTQLKTAILTALTSPDTNRYEHNDSRRIDKDATASVTQNDDKSVDTNVELIPDRIIVSQPQWTYRGQNQHERTAWVIMSTAEQAELALKLLKNLIVSVRDHEKVSVEITEVIYEFTLNAVMHSPRAGPILPEFLSRGKRVAADTKMAKEISELLDEERGVPEDNRLASLYDEDKFPEIVAALKLKPTYPLDLAIAYLRRVHFVVFYGGKRLHDEAHLLAVAPSILYRSVPYIQEDMDDDGQKIESQGFKSENEIDASENGRVANVNTNDSTEPNQQFIEQGKESGITQINDSDADIQLSGKVLNDEESKSENTKSMTPMTRKDTYPMSDRYGILDEFQITWVTCL